MTLEINVDHEADEVNIVYDDRMTLTAYRENDDIIYSKNFSKILEDDIYRQIKDICSILLKT
jgi:hypothetical protein